MISSLLFHCHLPFPFASDPEVAHNAIFAMGIVGAGTNNARLAAMLRQLAQYHQKDANNLFMVRLAQVTIKTNNISNNLFMVRYSKSSD